MKHNSNAVHTFLEKVLNALKIKYPTLQKFVYFSDGAGSQYKNYKAFSNLCHHESNLASMLSGISLGPPIGKALGVVSSL